MYRAEYILIRDIERCPYVPKDPEYDEWNRKNEARLAELSEARHNMLLKAHQYLSHEDRNVRNMAIFITWFFDRS